MNRSMLAVLALLASLPRVAAEPFALADGDRVVFLGSTLVEREQRTGAWEVALTRRWPAAAVTFRNLGWSGDTVFGHARGGFGSVADGYKHLREHVAAVKPTVLVVGYGTNEAFEGDTGLESFRQGLQKLLGDVAGPGARVVLVSPVRHEELGPPWPDPAGQNRNIEHYAGVLRETAAKRADRFVDLGRLLEEGSGSRAAPLTDNGMHLTPAGYWKAARALEKGLGLAPAVWQVELDARGPGLAAVGTKAVRQGGLAFEATDAMLPAPLEEGMAAGEGETRVLKVKGLDAGTYRLTIDGQEAARATGKEWEQGVPLGKGPEFAQAEALRAAVVAKNRQYFHRWRPQNETYLFGFRKHEQGQNAREIPQFDPVVAKWEQEIARLKKPGTHRYVLEKVK